MVPSGAEVTEDQIRRVIEGTSLEPTSVVAGVIRRAVDVAKSNSTVVNGQIVEVAPEYLDSVRGPFFFVRLAGASYRAANAATYEHRLATRPAPFQPQDSLDDYDMLFGTSFALPG
jgi:hypothetical protein